jgi:hypothetical protein
MDHSSSCKACACACALHLDPHMQTWGMHLTHVQHALSFRKLSSAAAAAAAAAVVVCLSPLLLSCTSLLPGLGTVPSSGFSSSLPSASMKPHTTPCLNDLQGPATAGDASHALPPAKLCTC